jgi:hypothetical protein
MKSQNMIQRASTMKYDIVGYPFFMLHTKHCNFFSFDQSLRLYTYYLSQYQLVRVLEFLIHWATHLNQFLSQNMTLLINFDLTPLQNCRRAYLTIC